MPSTKTSNTKPQTKPKGAKSAKQASQQSSLFKEVKGGGSRTGGQKFAAEILDVPVHEEVSEAFVAYSLSVISSRAIPDVRDGLKPVQRRILYSMFNMGIRPDTPHRKCARVVGDTMGNYHPHGDAAIYDALVRMGQDFARGITLVDPQGNFGSLDDPPAASRYTECRLTEPAMDLLAELNEETVDFRPTYDGESEEPIYLPSLLPNLILNGVSGIAVGMTTNMSPHNLTEVFAVIKKIVNNSKSISAKKLMELMPGPDFPGGGIIIDEGLEEVYKKGKGSFKVRAKTEIISLTPKRQAILITELPYLVGPERVVGKIKELMLGGRLPDISDIKNLSDRHQGLRIQIECRTDANPAATLQKLFKLTPLEETHAIYNVALVKGVPSTLSLYELAKHYIEHRLDVIVRRTKFRLKKAKERLHIVEGLVKALDNLDLVISIIRGSKTVDEARAGLTEKLKLTIIQADSILEMRLRRLTALEREKIIDEKAQLKNEVKEYEKLLASKPEQKQTLLRELAELVELYGRPRRTQIISSQDVMETELPPAPKKKIVEQPCVVTLSTSKIAGWAPVENEERSKPSRNDVLSSLSYSKTTAKAWAFTDQGRFLSTPVANLGKVEDRYRGTSSQQAFGTNAGENVLMVTTEDSNESLVAITEAGFIKHLDHTKFLSLKSGNIYINLKTHDKVASVFTSLTSKDDVFIATNDGQALRMKLKDLRPLGPSAAGILGIKLRPGAKVVGAGSCMGESSVVAVTNNSHVKVTPLTEFETKNRGGQGVKIFPLKNKQEINFVYVGALDEVLAIMADDKDANKIDPNPVSFDYEPTKKDLVPTKTERQILELGINRW